MEPLISKSEDYNYTFFRRMIENIKQTKDAQDPDDKETNMVCLAKVGKFVTGYSEGKTSCFKT